MYQTTRPDDPRPRRRPLLGAAVRSDNGKFVGFRRRNRLYHFDGEFWFEIGTRDTNTGCSPLIDASGRIGFFLTDSGDILAPGGEVMATLSSSRALLFILSALLVVCALAVAMFLMSRSFEEEAAPTPAPGASDTADGTQTVQPQQPDPAPSEPDPKPEPEPEPGPEPEPEPEPEPVSPSDLTVYG